MTDRSIPQPSSPRIATLDFVRGVAVIGILVANLPAFALPEAAYFSPAAWGGTSAADIAAWFATHVLIEGKMRGLFSFLFGASMLLVIDRARAAGESAARVHFSRMVWLFVFGCLHLYLFWWGDILAHYALVGAAAFLFARLPVRWLVALGAGVVGWQAAAGFGMAWAVFDAYPRVTPAEIGTWNSFASGFGVPSRDDMLAEIAAMRGPFAGAVAWRWENAFNPFAFLLFGGAETLGYMLFGMAGLRSGLLTGEWPSARYIRWAVVTLVLTLPLLALSAALTLRHDFDTRYVVLASMGVQTALRPFTIIGYACLLVLLIRPGGWLTERVAAAGRAAFTNYIGTTLLVTAIFNGWGLAQFGGWPRAQLYLLAPLVWIAMLAWSKPCLDRFAYGPLEWLWRSLARLEIQPMRHSREPLAKTLAS